MLQFSWLTSGRVRFLLGYEPLTTRPIACKMAGRGRGCQVSAGLRRPAGDKCNQGFPLIPQEARRLRNYKPGFLRGTKLQILFVQAASCGQRVSLVLGESRELIDERVGMSRWADKDKYCIRYDPAGVQPFRAYRGECAVAGRRRDRNAFVFPRSLSPRVTMEWLPLRANMEQADLLNFLAICTPEHWRLRKYQEFSYNTQKLIVVTTGYFENIPISKTHVRK